MTFESSRPTAADASYGQRVGFDIERVANLAKQWRRQLHAIPELGFAETLTADFIAHKLADSGIEVRRGIGGTGIVGVLQRGRSARCVGFRAEIDALPIHERNGFSHRSRHPGCMHACGHDGHIAMLLAAGCQLARSGQFDGTVHFIFQPAEETGSGALAMLRDGLFDRFPCDAIYAMHNRPSLPVGHFAVLNGPTMAAGGFFDICVRGRSAHAARPETGVDAILAASQIVAELHGPVTRTLSAVEPAVVTVTKIHAGNTYNVMPEEVSIGGTARVCSRSSMVRLEEALRHAVSLVAQSFGATAETQLKWVFPPTINDGNQAELVANVCSGIAGADGVHRTGAVNMASDDFGYLLEQVAGCYFNIGTGSASHACEVHHPAYDFNDDALQPGILAFVRLAETRLSTSDVRDD